MKKFLLAGAVAFLAVATAGCFHHSYTTGTGGNTEAEPTYNEWHSHWFFGIIGEENVDIKKVCPSGNATVKDGQTFVNGLIGALIGIVYHPTTVKVYCDGAPKASIELQPETMRRIARRTDLMRELQRVSPAQARELAAAIERADAKLVQTAAAKGSISTQ